MKKIVSLLAVLSLLVMSGCSLAQPKPENNAENTDRIIGVLVTTEYLDLFDFEAYLNDHASQLVGGNHVVSAENAAKYEGRIYAERQEEVYTREDGSSRTSITYTFPEELNGMFYMAYSVPATDTEDGYTTSDQSPGICDTAMELISKDDHQNQSLRLSATIYYDQLLSAWPDLDPTFYCNPVHQTPDGEVYVTSGNGSTVSSPEPYGDRTTQTIKEELTIDGDTVFTEVALTTNAVPCTKAVRLFHMSADNRVVSREELNMKELPTEISLHENATYLIAEIEDTQGGVKRSIANPDEPISIFTPYRDIILERHTITIA